MNLMPFADFLEAHGLGTKGKDVFINMMPMETTKGILLRNKLAGTPINWEIPGYYHTEFQIVVRHHDFATAETRINTVITLLQQLKDGYELESLSINYCRAVTLPVSFPLSKGNQIEFSVWMDVNFTA